MTKPRFIGYAMDLGQKDFLGIGSISIAGIHPGHPGQIGRQDRDTP